MPVPSNMLAPFTTPTADVAARPDRAPRKLPINTAGSAGGLSRFAGSTILVAEDCPDSRRLLTHFLRKAGYRVLIAADGDEALRMILEHGPELILLDGDMPGRDGFSVCQELRADPRTSSMPVIFLTGLSDRESKARGFKAGGVDYVCKPAEREELLARIQNHMELAYSRRILEEQNVVLQQVLGDKQGRLDEVRDGQEALLTQPGSVPGYKLAVRYQPAHEAGGDFYEIAALGEDDLGCLVADVSGHDLSVPFTTGALKALCATFMNESLTPEETLGMFNASLGRLLANERFVTCGYFRFSRTTMSVRVASAGHPAVILQAIDGSTRLIEPRGYVLGMFDTLQCDSEEVQVSPGQRLFLYTDGIVEGYRDSRGRQGRITYGLERLQNTLRTLHDRSVNEQVDRVVDEVLAEGDGRAEDDMVILGLEI